MKSLRYISTILLLLVAGGCIPIGQLTLSQNSAQSKNADTTVRRDTSLTDTNQSLAADSLKTLSPAAELMVEACRNYLEVNPSSPKIPEVLSILGSAYYEEKFYSLARQTYQQILEQFPNNHLAYKSVELIAQSFYEEKDFESAQVWYRKLRDRSSEGIDREEATARIAESIFRMAELHEESKRFDEAAGEYERVSLEFPDSKIADVSLLNAGLCYEKAEDWSQAVLAYQRLVRRYPESKHAPRGVFRTAKSYENMKKWEQAARTYLQLVTDHPSAPMVAASLYNAGYCFEEAQRLSEAAAVYEQLATAFPNDSDAADVLFRAGELYGEMKNWEAVTRVNKQFSVRYGNDVDRAVQAVCMVGIAFYMQEKVEQALTELRKAIEVYSRLRSPSTTNSFYAAKAQFTIAEIFHERSNAIHLKQPKAAYARLLQRKSDLLREAVEAYSHVVELSVSEWTTRSIYQIGVAYEDFGLGVFRQERPDGMNVEKQLALELGIAQAVDQYFIDKALHYHEQNVKLGIREKIENEYILGSRKKLTYLPYMAGSNYLSLVDLAYGTETDATARGDFALIAKKLETLQQIAPFQERAIELFMKGLELGTMYEHLDDFYDKSGSLITKTSHMVGGIYSEVVDIARGAPIPDQFDAYERFVYKTKLLKQIEQYEENAVTAYIKTVRIAEAYEIRDTFVDAAADRIARTLFERGRCYDLLFLTAFHSPPFPNGTSEMEQEEYRARFEELGLRFQDQAIALYESILEYAEDGLTQGLYVTHAYVRLYQIAPEQYGEKSEKNVRKTITPGKKWRLSSDTTIDWRSISYADTSWRNPGASGPLRDSLFPAESFAIGANRPLFVRRTFYVPEQPQEAQLHVRATGPIDVSMNEQMIAKQDMSPDTTYTFPLVRGLRIGENALALAVRENSYGRVTTVYPVIDFTVQSFEYLPRPPGHDTPLPRNEVAFDTYTYPTITNFEIPKPAEPAGKQENGNELD